MNKDDTVFINSSLLSKFVTMKYLPRWIVLVVDLFLCVIAFLIAIYLSTKINDNKEITIVTEIQRIAILMFSQYVLFWVFHTYSGVLRYSSFVDATKIFFSILLNVVLIFAINAILTYVVNIELFYLTELVIYGVLSFLFLLLIRLLVKTSYDYFTQAGEFITPVMIYGTKSASIGIAKMLMSEQVGSRYKLVGFIDDDKSASEKMIMGVKVYHLNDESLKRTIVKKCKSIIISPTKLSQVNSSDVLEKFINHNLTILSVTPMNIWKNDIPNIKEIKSIPIENLLERPQIDISTENISSQLQNKVVLVTGAAGSIGSEIAFQVLKYETKLLVLLDQAESQMHDLKLDLQEKYDDKNISFF